MTTIAPSLKRIHHVAYRCKDAKETVEWYARVLGMDSEIGSLVPGKRADIVAIRPFEGAPVEADPSLVVLDPRSQVVAAWVDGEQVLDAGASTRLDTPAIVADATEARQRIM